MSTSPLSKSESAPLDRCATSNRKPLSRAYAWAANSAAGSQPAITRVSEGRDSLLDWWKPIVQDTVMQLNAGGGRLDRKHHDSASDECLPVSTWLVCRGPRPDRRLLRRRRPEQILDATTESLGERDRHCDRGNDPLNLDRAHRCPRDPGTTGQLILRPAMTLPTRFDTARTHRLSPSSYRFSKIPGVFFGKGSSCDLLFGRTRCITRDASPRDHDTIVPSYRMDRV